MKLGRWFSLEEMTLSEWAIRHGYENAPADVAIANLEALCSTVLDPLRSHVAKPVHVLSGYRSPVVNVGVGGARTSQHVHGEAADISVSGMGVRQLVELIRSLGLPYDQLIDEFGRWVHVSHKRFGPQRGQVMEARRGDRGTVYSTI